MARRGGGGGGKAKGGGRGGAGGGSGGRKYARDNNGRFASTGTGATARGGRLKTAAGNKRATQTMQAGSRAGVIGKPAGLAPGSIRPKAKPMPKASEKQRNLREFMNQNRGAIARDYKRDAQAFRAILPKKEQVAGGPKTVGGALEALASKSYLRGVSRQGLASNEVARATRLIADNSIKGYKMERTAYGTLVTRNGGVSAKAARLAEAAVSRKMAKARKPRRNQ